ncbi:MAG: type VI secretion system tube protein Hcp [Caenispirillum sp.]|nr:type VI secretion system tube protein Hcp [Caenispirillum sp.]
MAQVILDIPSIKGESGLQGYEGKILCETLSHDMEIEIEMTSNARRTVHIPTVNNFVLSRKWDSASVKLIGNMLRATVDSAPWKIICLKGLGETGAMQKPFLTVELEKPIFSKYSLEVNEGDTTENLEINAVVVSWTYEEYDSEQKKTGNWSVKFDTISGKVGE